MKQYLCTGLLVGWALAASAQRPYRGLRSRKLPVKFGLRLGLNYSNTNFNQGAQPVPFGPIPTVWRPGFLAGALVQIDLNRWLSLQQEYSFSQQGGERRDSATRYRMRYLSLPLLVKYQVSDRVTLVAGPQFDLMIATTAKANGQTKDITHDTEDRAVGAVAGLEIRMWRNISLSSRFLQGFNHVGIGQRSVVQEFKWQSAQLAAEVRF
ncbi:MAG TPA: porin family protein [Hymenobacter sp.]|uniref:porin family protein n=1 Tax=Hymenobacter sp. TaxID=1898978 RepID=UPI002D7E44B8|nr:porin family protein [Hymenobacter sp.]HET9503108.1 porin family protein [Hymenobacter sp.]